MAATTADPVQRIEIVSERRRRHDAAFRARVVSESLVAGTRVQDLARRHGICPSLVYRWRRAAGIMVEQAPPPGFLPVRIVGEPPSPPPRPAPGQAPVEPAASAPRRAGIIEIELAGGVCVRVEETVSLAALRRVLGVLRG